MLDEVVPFFRNSYKIRPTSLQGKKCLREVILYKKYPLYLGKLTLGKGRRAGFWYQNQGEITNFLLILASDSAASGSNDYQKSTMSTLTDA